MSRTGYKFDRHECPICGKMIADNWWMRHMRIHQPSMVVALTPQSLGYLAALGTPAAEYATTVEEALRIYRHLGSFIDLMMRIGILPADFDIKE